MDANKRLKLLELGYRINDTCGRCQYGMFKGYEWGICSKHTYSHQKHTESERPLSIHNSGYCGPDHFEPKSEEDLHGFYEITEKSNAKK